MITSLPPPESGPELNYHSLDDQLALLSKVFYLLLFLTRNKHPMQTAGTNTLSISQVLSAGDDAVGLEQLEEDADGMALQKARRTAGSMSAMSGAKGMVYMEYRYAFAFHSRSFFYFFFVLLLINIKISCCSTGQRRPGQGQIKSKPKDPNKRHHLFKKRFG